VYGSVVPHKQETLQESCFEKLSVEELGAYARAIISINTVLGGSLTPPSQRSKRPVVKSLKSSAMHAHPSLVLRPLPTYPHPPLKPPIYCNSVSTKKTDHSQTPDVTSSGLFGPRISRLPGEEKLLYRKLLSVIRDKKCCKLLLQGKGESQSILDLLHHVS
jgi:hypothetical protein